jgi:hypothetical protein
MRPVLITSIGSPEDRLDMFVEDLFDVVRDARAEPSFLGIVLKRLVVAIVIEISQVSQGPIVSRPGEIDALTMAWENELDLRRRRELKLELTVPARLNERQTRNDVQCLMSPDGLG